MTKARRIKGKLPDAALATTCNLCGGSEFRSGPAQRLSATGLPPLCLTCFSLERHRSLRKLYMQIQQHFSLKNFSCLQISTDGAILSDWFASHAVSIFSEQHSIDIQKIEFPDENFDVVICNHVLEHVPDDRKALQELFRVVSEEGFLQLGVPDPIRRTSTQDWGFARQEDHGHYRIYGIDILEKIKTSLPSAILIEVIEHDPVTDMKDIYFILTKSENVVDKILSAYPSSTVTRPDPALMPKKVSSPKSQYVLNPAILGNPRKFNEYVLQGGQKRVNGWITQGALTAITSLSSAQEQMGIKGHMCEIGVHHGRLFLALSLMRRLGEKSLAIDVFENQDANVDQSGLGDSTIFTGHVAQWLGKPSEADVRILTADSLTVTSGDIIEKLGGRVRLFSVDGSHTAHHTLNDIRLAEGSVCEGGVVIVDDFLNPAWPGVIEAVVLYLNENRPGSLVPFAYGDNKFYFTTAGYQQTYIDYLSGHMASAMLKYKLVEMGGQPLIFVRFDDVEKVMAAPALKVGETMGFGTSLPLRPKLLKGWSNPERSGCWAIAKMSGFAFSVDTGEQDIPEYKFELTLNSFRNRLNPDPTISIFLFGEPVSTIHFAAGGPDSIVVPISVPASAVGVSGRIEIWLGNDHLVSPNDLADSPDQRTLSALALKLDRIL